MVDFMFTLWDVEHGLAIWIQTPNGHNHCIDAGHNNDENFSPFHHMYYGYGVKKVDYLIISHPDKDHIEGLPSLVKYLGRPSVFTQNKSLPQDMMFGDCNYDYQIEFKYMNETFNSPVEFETSTLNPRVNGGVNVKNFNNAFIDGMSCNDTSIVSFYTYRDYLFVCPGDIEPAGWRKLMSGNDYNINVLVNMATTIILVAPHHGRQSGYCQDMIDVLKPTLVLISDKYGKEPTAPGFYSAGLGLNIGGNLTKSLSTKSRGRIQFTVYSDGTGRVDTAN